MEEHREPLAEHQHEVTQVDPSLGSVLGLWDRAAR